MLLRRNRRPKSVSAADVPLSFDDRDLESRLTWILGSPRTGSTWLLRMLVHPLVLANTPAGVERPRPRVLADYPKVVAINEPLVANHLVPLRRMDMSGRPDAGSWPLVNTPERRARFSYLLADAYEEVWRAAFRDAVLRRLHAQVWQASAQLGLHRPLVLIKEPNGSHGADLVMSLMTRSRLVFLLRDPRDVIDSQLALRLHRVSPDLRVIPNDDQERRLEFVLENAHLWLHRTEAVQRAFEAHDPERRLLVRYEDVRTDPAEEMRRLLDWLGIQRSDQQLHAAVKAETFERLPARRRGIGKPRRAATPGLWRKSLTETEQGVVGSVLGEKLAELGYKS